MSYETNKAADAARDLCMALTKIAVGNAFIQLTRSVTANGGMRIEVVQKKERS